MAIKVDIDKCTGCGNCKEVCPMEAITIKDNKAVIGDTCAECSVCISACPNNALAF